MLAFGWKRAQWWQQQAKDRAADTGYLAEGRIAYAMEQGKSEERRAIHWASMWNAVRERATVVLTSLLAGEDESAYWLPELRVVIRDDEGDEAGGGEEEDEDE